MFRSILSLSTNALNSTKLPESICSVNRTSEGDLPLGLEENRVEGIRVWNFSVRLVKKDIWRSFGFLFGFY